MRIKAFFSAVAIVPSLATAATPIRLAASSPWIVDYAANSCRLIRHFGEGKDTTILALESEAPGAIDMLVAGRPLATSLEDVFARFVPVQIKPISGIVGITTDKHEPMVLWSTVRLLPDEAVAAVDKREADRKAHPAIRP